MGKSEENTERKTRATSADVAKLAGVSRTQVSYVLNKTGVEHVSEEKRNRIIHAARELAYQPHQSAQALRKGYSNEFGLFFPAPYSARINAMLGTIHEMGLENDCMPTQYSFNSYRDAERKNEAFQAMVARRPIGIFCSLLDVTREDIDYARERGIERILVLDVEQHEDLDTLYMPLEPVGYLVAKHLLDLGHRHLGIIRPADPIQARGFDLRCRGMRRGMEAYTDARLSILDWSSENNRPTLEYAAEFVNRTLLGTNRPSALYTYSDDYAYTVQAVLQDRGIHIPGDISLVGTDDLPYSALVRPALTTVRIDSTGLGEQAVALINALISGVPAPAFDHVPSLVRRQSSAQFRQ